MITGLHGVNKARLKQLKIKLRRHINSHHVKKIEKAVF